MIHETFNDVRGVEHEVIITPEWDVIFDKNQRKNFSSSIGPLVVATIVRYFDTFREKTDILQLSLDTYLDLLERGFTVLEHSPSEFTPKEIGDKFDAFVRKKDLPLRQNVYHIGKLAFRKIVFLSDPTNMQFAEELFESAVPNCTSEEGRVPIIDSYSTSFLDKRNKYARGLEQPKNKASKATLDRLSRGLVDVSTRATRRNSSDLYITNTVNTIDLESTDGLDVPIVESDIILPQIVEYSNVTEYGEIAYRHLEDLTVGREISELDMRKFLEFRGFNADIEDISKILILATRNRLGIIKNPKRLNDGEITSVTFIKK